jgi:hypothetical protein
MTTPSGFKNKQTWGADEVIGANYSVTTTFFKAIIDCLAQISIIFY